MTHGQNDYFGWQQYRASSAVGITFKRGYYKRDELIELISRLTQVMEDMQYGQSR